MRSARFDVVEAMPVGAVVLQNVLEDDVQLPQVVVGSGHVHDGRKRRLPLCRERRGIPRELARVAADIRDVVAVGLFLGAVARAMGQVFCFHGLLELRLKPMLSEVRSSRCHVPKGQTTIARRFNAGSGAKIS